jgi:protein SCO1/2
MNRAFFITAAIAGLLGGILAAQFWLREDASPAPLEHATAYPEPRPLPAFTLVDQRNAALGPERLRGAWTFVFFGFVNCPDICPTTLATLASARRTLADLPAGQQPRVVLVSVDPGRDTPALLGQYVAHFDPTFTGATGSPEAIEALTRALGVAVFIGPPDADGNYAVDHSAAVFLVDPDARVAALFNTPHEAEAIARDYRRIVGAG